MEFEKRVMIEETFTENSELQLWRCEKDGKEDYEIIINGVFIMATYNSSSSEFLIRNAVSRLGGGENLSVLIAGLGMGFTVAEACRHDSIKAIDVVEVETVVADWNRRYFRKAEGFCLEDRRVSLYIEDFYRYVVVSEKSYDIVSIDIDNGPMLLVNEGNGKVYTSDFLEVVRGAMKPGGICVIWSCGRDSHLNQSMETVFDEVEVEEIIEDYKGRDVSYFLYFGRKRCWQ